MRTGWFVSVQGVKGVGAAPEVQSRTVRSKLPDDSLVSGPGFHSSADPEAVALGPSQLHPQPASLGEAVPIDPQGPTTGLANYQVGASISVEVRRADASAIAIAVGSAEIGDVQESPVAEVEKDMVGLEGA